MSRSQRKKKKKSSSKSFIYLIILAAVVGYLGWFFLNEFTYRNNYNSLVAAIDESFQSGNEGLAEVTGRLESFYESHKANPEREPLIGEHLIKCYRAMASDPGLSLKEQVKILKKIRNLDAHGLTVQEEKIVGLTD